jgi:hypothetical protein
MTPYDTGKVKIGIAYQPTLRYETSFEDDILQAALLKPATKPLWNRLLWWLNV